MLHDVATEPKDDDERGSYDLHLAGESMLGSPSDRSRVNPLCQFVCQLDRVE